MMSIAQYKLQMHKRMLSAVQSAARAAGEYARAAAPYGDGRDGGHLRDSISCHAVLTTDKAVGEVTAASPHAAYVEMGTSRMAAQPYLRLALQKQKDAFKQSLVK